MSSWRGAQLKKAQGQLYIYFTYLPKTTVLTVKILYFFSNQYEKLKLLYRSLFLELVSEQNCSFDSRFAAPGNLPPSSNASVQF
jgi:hypothetical protein